MSSLFEQYRPRRWNEVVGQSKALATIEGLRTRGLSGRAFWLSGQSGTGKTTIARLLRDEIASEDDCVELDAGELTETSVRELAKGLAYRGLTGKGRVVIVNEAHGLRKGVVRALLVLLESIPRHAAWIFTTTNDGQETLLDDQMDACPLLSRVIELPLARRDLANAFAARVREIALAENLGDAPLADFVKLAKECRNNFRQMLCKVEAGVMRKDA